MFAFEIYDDVKYWRSARLSFTKGVNLVIRFLFCKKNLYILFVLHNKGMKIKILSSSSLVINSKEENVNAF